MGPYSRRRPHWFALFALLWIPAGILADEAKIVDETYDRADQIVDQEKSKVAGNLAKQAEALVALAWPPGGGDPLVASIARGQLMYYGAEGLQALRAAVRTVDPRFQFDVVVAILEIKSEVSGGIPSEYLPAVDDAIWFGSLESKRVAIPEAARHRYPLALLPIMDAAAEHPALVPVAVKALGDFRNPRSRAFLKEIMLHGHPYERVLAARALGRIGDSGIATLREAARDADQGCRTAAMETLLPVTGTDDLSLLHEYVSLYPDENPRLHGMVLQRALLLESIQETRMDAEGTSFD